jgi:hypothetical protein
MISFLVNDLTDYSTDGLANDLVVGDVLILVHRYLIVRVAANHVFKLYTYLFAPLSEAQKILLHIHLIIRIYRCSCQGLKH